MCNLQKKLILFDHAVTELANKIAEKAQRTREDVLSELSTTQLMKLLYFISLNSVNDGRNSYKDTLFGVFDNWIAYPNGPVEENVYMSLTYLPTIQKYVEQPYRQRKEDDSETSKLLEFFNQNLPKGQSLIDENQFNDLSQRQELLLTTYQLKQAESDINDAINAIAEMFQYSVNKLIQTSHSGMLWGAAQYDKNKIMCTSNIYLLRDEQKKIWSNSNLKPA